jgi:hypothetical protein
VAVICREIEKYSTISTYETVEVIATFIRAVSPSFNCRICKDKWKEDARKAKGCLKPVNNMVSSWDFSHTKSYSYKLKFYRCPSIFFNAVILEHINLLTRWRNGEQFYSGGLFEYPAKFVELMQLIDNVTEEYQAAEQAKVKKYNGK